jgi:hypothetical protein
MLMQQLETVAFDHILYLLNLRMKYNNDIQKEQHQLKE